MRIPRHLQPCGKTQRTRCCNSCVWQPASFHTRCADCMQQLRSAEQARTWHVELWVHPRHAPTMQRTQRENGVLHVKVWCVAQQHAEAACSRVGVVVTPHGQYPCGTAAAQRHTACLTNQTSNTTGPMPMACVPCRIMFATLPVPPALPPTRARSTKSCGSEYTPENAVLHVQVRCRPQHYKHAGRCTAGIVPASHG